MAITSYRNLLIQDELVRSGYTDYVREAETVFNEVGFGGFRYSLNFREGTHPRSSFWKEPNSLISRRDALAATNDAQTPTVLTEDQVSGVKVSRKAKPFEVRLGSLRQRRIDLDNYFFRVGMAYGRQTMVDYLNTCLDLQQTLVAKDSDNVSNQAAATFDVKMLSQHLLQKYSGAAQNCACLVTHSDMQYILQRKEYDDNVYNVGAMMIAGGNPLTWGKPVVYLDNDKLKLDSSDSVTGITGTDIGYRVYAVNVGAWSIEQDQEPEQLIMPVALKENIAVSIQREWDYSITAQGYAYDTSTTNPTDANLKDATKWTKKYADSRELVGYELIVKP